MEQRGTMSDPALRLLSSRLAEAAALPVVQLRLLVLGSMPDSLQAQLRSQGVRLAVVPVSDASLGPEAQRIDPDSVDVVLLDASLASRPQLLCRFIDLRAVLLRPVLLLRQREQLVHALLRQRTLGPTLVQWHALLHAGAMVVVDAACLAATPTPQLAELLSLIFKGRRHHAPVVGAVPADWAVRARRDTLLEHLSEGDKAAFNLGIEHGLVVALKDCEQAEEEEEQAEEEAPGSGVVPQLLRDAALVLRYNAQNVRFVVAAYPDVAPPPPGVAADSPEARTWQHCQAVQQHGNALQQEGVLVASVAQTIQFLARLQGEQVE